MQQSVNNKGRAKGRKRTSKDAGPKDWLSLVEKVDSGGWVGLKSVVRERRWTKPRRTVHVLTLKALNGLGLGQGIYRVSINLSNSLRSQNSGLLIVPWCKDSGSVLIRGEFAYHN